MKLCELFVFVFLICSFSAGSSLIDVPVLSVQQMVISAQTDSTIPASQQTQDTLQKGPSLHKRTYDHKQQVLLGIGMMAFITIIFSTVQSWNP